VSANLAVKIQLGLDELAAIRRIMSPLIARTGEPELPLWRRRRLAQCSIRFTRKSRKILKLIALDIDK
jgi:hypothetical protein